jgi:Flp pilus assembly protein TadG
VIRSPRSRRRAEAGSAAVEGALTMSVLLLTVVGTAEFARLLWTYNTMVLTVEEAARYAMRYPHAAPMSCASQVGAAECPAASDTLLANCSASYAQQALSAYQLPNVSISVAEDATSSPTTATVCASYSFDFIAPRLLPYGPLNLVSRVTVPLI